MKRKLVLSTGQSFVGDSFGAVRDAVCEIVFNTSMVGYQEILSDPSYTDQAVVMTYPLIGNYGTAEDDYESKVPTIGAMIVRHYNEIPSNFRSTAPLGSVMERFDIPGLCGVDTRAITRLIRDYGSQKVLLTGAEVPTEECLARLNDTELPRDAVARVSCPWMEVHPVSSPRFHVAAIDCGMKKSIVTSLNRLGCSVTVLPYDTPAAQIEALRPDGVFLSNGPGDPEDVPAAIETVRTLLGEYPIFGICLGHQILSLAYGAKTYKLKFGHRGGNHPVRAVDTGKIEITSQNHSYAVDARSLSATPLRVTHVNLLDGTIEGVRCERDEAFSVQYHPESAPGPQDSAYLFGQFLDGMERRRHA